MLTSLAGIRMSCHTLILSVLFGATLSTLLLPSGTAVLGRGWAQEVVEPDDGSENSAAESSAASGDSAVQVQVRMPVQVVAGRLITRCEISTRARRIPGNFIIDFDRKCGLELHNRAADGIRVDSNGGLPMTLHFPGSNLRVARREHGDEEFLEEITKLYSKELGETSCIGTLGADLLKEYHVTFALKEGFIYLEPPRAQDTTAPTENAQDLLTSVTLTNDLVWIPVRLSDHRVLSMCVATSTMDSIVNVDLAEDMNAADGAVGSVMLQTLDLSKFVAFRPEDFVQVHADGVFGSMGLNLLQSLRVEIDRVNQRVWVRQVAEPEFPAGDLAFFQARVMDEPEPLVEFLGEHSENRLAREAAQLLLNLQLDYGADTEEFALALEWIDKTRIEDLRCTEALKVMDSLIESGRSDVAVLAGELGVKSGRKDRYPESVHKLHAKLGELLLRSDDTQKAWEHLLSAAFGLPDDGPISLHLGEFYEKEGRLRRAMSRYVQAVVTPEAGAQAVKGLERVQSKLGGERLSVDLVDRMVSGKVHNFSAATSWKATEATTNNRTVLCELYTNPHFGRELTEGWQSFAIGGAMAVEGLLSHFPRERVAVLCYHLDTPEPHALYNGLTDHMKQKYGIGEPTLLKINGTINGPGAGRWRQAEQVYERNRTAVEDALSRESEFDLKLDATLKDGVVTGALTVTGPAKARDSWRVQLVLAERGVLYPGKAKIVVHRMVARAALLGEAGEFDGVAYAPINGSMNVAFSKSLESLRIAHEKFLTSYEAQGGGATTRLSTRIDPRQVTLVACVRDLRNGAVLQAVQIDPEGAEPKEGQQ